MVHFVSSRHFPRVAAFTLIELSIVLVIIGLLVGSVVVGRSLIKTAETRKLISAVSEYQLAIGTFKAKYSCLPGDCTGAVGMLGASSNGNGNGVIDRRGYYSPNDLTENQFVCSGSEAILANEQLARAGLVSLQPFDATNAANCVENVGWIDPLRRYSEESGVLAGTGLVVMNTTGGMFLRLGGRRSYVGFDLYGATTSTLAPSEAYAIDVKLDDGKPRTGAIWNQVSIAAGVKSDWSAVNQAPADCQTNANGDWEYVARDSIADPGPGGWLSYCGLYITPQF